MVADKQQNISGFFIVGINYKKTDASVRGQFAINNIQYANILSIAPSFGLSEFFILSTCNRTEIYGFADNACQLVEVLCSQTEGDIEMFKKLCYVKQGSEAIQHIFEVGAGLESQILGDYEIIGQLKLAVKFSKESGFIGAFTERLVNSVIQSTKVIKNKTALSGGTVSVSFAAVQYIKKNVSKIADKNILLLGIGKIGRNTCKNLVDYLNTKRITLINRTEEKARELASELGLQSASMDDLSSYVQSSDIILVATNSNEPIILKSHLENFGDKLIIDLSIPYNVEKEAQELSNVTLINVDQLSKLKDETLQKRVAEIPAAKAIIAEHKEEFLEWSHMRKNVPFIKAVKQKLHDMHNCELYLSSYSSYTSNTTSLNPVNVQAIQKVIKNMAVKMRQQHQPGCSYIEAINDFITTHRN
ncbi:glutamyl-tRNA reductase [Segetibacter aerophilus]|uniref:Glutamyl-tRNA reductase n=1 Tax=Segetibacter aerophilus TaxID=670293 RepID=A0A512BCW5_9BACT|nr:glutamyl-tRNA reductase [Segetibacter aerophilus]GEO09801.1 glutamyl-tRNA reductase [Segetibacter aerophilus]